jgi:uncharacterized membrane protein HdeD (DUF308 family)
MDGLSTAYSQSGVSLYAMVVVACLLAFAIGYAVLVRNLRRRQPHHTHTAWLVVVGNAAIVVAFTLLTSLVHGALLLGLMAIAGIPMIVEYVDDTASHQTQLEL